tara:strand:- start:200 stop:439 length:240 start_codon:yes stop_codon:yes gene_type:complete
MDKQLTSYDDIVNNFEQFCDEFEDSAARRFSGLDDDSRQPIKHDSVERVTPAVVREVDVVGTEDLQLREPPIDVQASEV